MVRIGLCALKMSIGILILTRNRIGTLDKEFESYIRLNLRLGALDDGQRLRIWKNFLERLERLKTNCLASDATQDHELNMEEINVEVEVLARVELTGRQI